LRCCVSCVNFAQRRKKMVAVKTVAILLRLITKDPKRNEPKWAKTLIDQVF